MASLVLNQARQFPRVRELRLLVRYPIFGPGFTQIPPGWQDGLYYDEPEDLRDLVPERNPAIIHAVLMDLTVDFPFKTEADRQNFIGLLLTPLVAPALDGNRPMHLLNAPLERTGKTKLVNEVLGGVIIGQDEIPCVQITTSEDERDRRILGMLLSDQIIVHLDNLPSFIDSQTLSSILTSSSYSSRVIRTSTMINLPNNLIVIGTGNNVYASGEVAKRIVPILLEPKDAHPEKRTDFKHPDLRAYVREHRRQVMACLIGAVENWVDSGKPLHRNRLGGFENWAGTVGGILHVNGFDDWRANEERWRQQADPRGAELLSFVEAWFAKYGLEAVEPQKLRELALRNGLFPHILSKGKAEAAGVAFGHMLSSHVDTPIGSSRIRRTGASNHSKYHLEEIKG